MVIKWDPISSLEDPRHAAVPGVSGCAEQKDAIIFSHRCRIEFNSRERERERESKGDSFSLFRNSIRRAPQAYYYTYLLALA